MEAIMIHLFKTLSLFSTLILFPLSHLSFASELTEEEMERWLNSDDLNPPQYKEVDVNNGELFFLSKIPDKPIHHHTNILTIYKQSLNDGWIKLEQCHRNMDRVPRVQVVFKKERVKDIRITKSDAIEKAWVEKNTVQLENVTDNAVLCITARSKALIKNADGSFHLTNGPFMRKFLDGYYPIHVTIDVNFAATNLELVQFEPIRQDGFKVTKTAKTINMDAWFEGRLKTNLLFVN